MIVGSLCSGYGGLELGLGLVSEVDVAWISDIDPGARAVLAARYPGVPNLGDVTTIDWKEVMPKEEPAIDVLTAGYP